MQGFFSKKETESVSASKGVIHSCASCGLYKDCATPKMKPYGNFKKGIMCIGEYPDVIDDEVGKPWQGPAGRILRHSLKRMGIDLFEDCINLNAVNCYSANEPSGVHVDHCRSVVVWKAIKEYQPKLILLFGPSALNSVIGYQWGKGVDMKSWRGHCIPDQILKSWICPTFDPEFLRRMDEPRDYMEIWERDIQRGLDKIENSFPRFSKPDIEIVKDPSFLKDKCKNLAAFDYETTGLKPHAKGHRIACVSIADNENHAWVFPSPKSKKHWYPFRRWLADPSIPKMAHNLKFEDIWSKEILKVRVRGWEWDSMLAAHVLDNRTHIASLKMQTYINFGIQDYSTEITPYLKSAGGDGSGNDKNRVLDLMRTKSGRDQLMRYCALDSVYQYRLALRQMDQLDWDFLPF